MWNGWIKLLWKEVGEASGKRGGRGQEHDGKRKSRRGVGYRVRSQVARPRNKPVRELLPNERHMETELRFAGSAGVGMIRTRGRGTRQSTKIALSFFPAPSAFLSSVR